MLTPIYPSLGRIGAATVSTANGNRDGTATIVTVLTAASGSTRLNRVVLKATGDPADCVVTLFLHDGSTYFLFDEVDIGNPAAGSATVTTYRDERAYSDVILPSGWSLRAAITVAPTTGVVNVLAFGEDLT